MERTEAAEGAAWLQWRKVARSTKEKGKEEGEADESGERTIRHQGEGKRA